MLTNENLCAIIIDALGICVKVAQQTLTLYVWVRILDPQPKNPESKCFRIFSFVPTGTTSFAWHTQHHLTVRSTSLPPTAQMNEVEALPQTMLQQVANDVMLRIKDVALRANGAVSVCLVR